MHDDDHRHTRDPGGHSHDGHRTPTEAEQRESARIVVTDRMLRYLVYKTLRGEPIDPKDEPLSAFLRIPAGSSKEVALASLSEFVVTLGKVRCPNCDAVVKDVEGKTDEACASCGTFLGSLK